MAEKQKYDNQAMRDVESMNRVNRAKKKIASLQSRGYSLSSPKPGPIKRAVKAVGSYLNKVSGAAMFDAGGKHGPKAKSKVSPNSTGKTVNKPKNKW